MSYFYRIARQQRPLPDAYTLTRLCARTRAMLRAHPVEDPIWIEDEPAPADDIERILLSFVRHQMPELDQNPRVQLRAVEMRLELLGQLAYSNKPRLERRTLGGHFALDHIAHFSGWERQVALGPPEFQLDRARPWWKPGSFMSAEQERKRVGPGARALRRAGFIQLDRQAYLERVRHSIVRLLLTTGDPSPLQLLGAIIALYTASRAERHEMNELTTELAQTLLADSFDQLNYQGFALPLKPLYSLPRESRDISSFFISYQDRDTKWRVDEDTGVIHGPFDHAKVRVVQNQTGQQALFFDRDLVSKRSQSGDSYISVKINEPQLTVLDALVQAIEQLGVDSTIFEHIPRVCAGMFSAAQRDRKLQFNWPGTFWDTESGARLCLLIGFNPSNPRHRKRIQQTRQLLEAVILHREVRGRDDAGRKARMHWSGPLIEPRKGQLELEVIDREGFSEHHTLQSWSIAKELWDMVLPESEGGTPAFMVIDRRAFLLDDRSSRPFNLYWTLVNRAYMGAYTSILEDQVQEDGTFSPKLGTLFSWAGLDGTWERPARLKPFLCEAFDSMVRYGLLRSWSCPVLDQPTATREDIYRARITVVFGEQQLRSLRGQLEGEQPAQLEE